jgi:hypothetical protein
VHAQARSLSEGKLEGSTVTCPNHAAQFNVCTGEVLRGPAKDPLKTYRVIVNDDIGRVRLAPRRSRKRSRRLGELKRAVAVKPARTILKT